MDCVNTKGFDKQDFFVSFRNKSGKSPEGRTKHHEFFLAVYIPPSLCYETLRYYPFCVFEWKRVYLTLFDSTSVLFHVDLGKRISTHPSQHGVFI